MKNNNSIAIKKNIDEREKVEYNPGTINTNIAFIFACPGQEEKNKGSCR